MHAEGSRPAKAARWQQAQMHADARMLLLLTIRRCPVHRARAGGNGA
jgi:hypothetical protein